MDDTYRFGDWLVERNANRLTRGGESRQLEPLTMDVLALLLGRRGEVVSADDILDHVWSGRHADPGMVKKRIAQIRQVLDDDPRRPVYIETIPKRGYRTLAPVSVEPGDPPAVRRWPLAAAVAAVALLMLLGSLAWYGGLLVEPTPPHLPRVAVESFTTSQREPRLERYAVLLRNALMDGLLRGSPGGLDVAQSEGAAEFLIRGHLAEVSGDVRLIVQVVDVRQQTLLWSKALDLPREPTADLLNTRPAHIAAVVWTVTSLWEKAVHAAGSAEAARAYIAGVVEHNEAAQGLGGDFGASLAHFERASRLDPEFQLPLIHSGYLYRNRLYGQLRWTDAVGPAHDYVQRALSLARDGSSLGPGLFLLGGVALSLDLDYDTALASLAEARAEGIPASLIEFESGLAYLTSGRLQEAIDGFDSALRLGAGDNRPAAHVWRAHAYFAGGKYASAVRAADEAVVQAAGTGDYMHGPALVLQTYSRYYSGDRDGARQSLEELRVTHGETMPYGLASLLALLGETDAARRLLQDAETRWSAGEPLTNCVGGGCFWGYYYLDDLDRAFVWLDRAIDERLMLWLGPQLHRSPILDPIRGDPRFVAAMAHLAQIESAGRERIEALRVGVERRP